MDATSKNIAEGILSARGKITWQNAGSEDLTNAQFPIFNSHPMKIEHWELSIGQIPGLIRQGYCQVIFARALSI